MKKTRRNFIKTAGTYSLGGILFNSLPISALSAMRKTYPQMKRLILDSLDVKEWVRLI